MDHKRPKWEQSRGGVKRISGRKLQAQRHALFTREPLCRVCKAAGRVTLASVRDHIVPLAEGGQDMDDNVQPLCGDCHDEKTATESRRGRGLAAAASQRAGQGGGVLISAAPKAETDPQAKFSRAGVSTGGVSQQLVEVAS